MKRRDFIKAFSGAAATVASATTLASINGSEKIIETFQTSDIKSEIELTQCPRAKAFRYHTSYVPVLSYNHEELHHYQYRNIDMIKREKVKFYRITNVSQIRGLRRGSIVLGLFDYWKKAPDDVMEQIHLRNLIIVNGNVFWNARARGFISL